MKLQENMEIILGGGGKEKYRENNLEIFWWNFYYLKFFPFFVNFLRANFK